MDGTVSTRTAKYALESVSPLVIAKVESCLSGTALDVLEGSPGGFQCSGHTSQPSTVTTNTKQSANYCGSFPRGIAFRPPESQYGRYYYYYYIIITTTKITLYCRREDDGNERKRKQNECDIFLYYIYIY